MVVAAFLRIDQANKVRFFEKTFLVVNISSDVVLGMPFFTLNGADVDFLKRESYSGDYISLRKPFLPLSGSS